MDTIAQHFQDNALYYLIGLVVAAPIVFFTRKYSLPLLQFLLESAIYSGLMHVIVGTIVRVAAWFKNNSSMEVDVLGNPAGAVEWTTPYIEFWDRSAYNPEWVIYMEGVFVLLILAAVFRLRPMRVHNPHQRKYDDAGKKLEGGARGRGGKGAKGRPGKTYVRPEQRSYGRQGRR